MSWVDVLGLVGVQGLINVRPREVGVANNEPRDILELACINVVMWRGRLRWFGLVERMGDGNWVKRVRRMNVEGVFITRRPKKTGNEAI